MLYYKDRISDYCIRHGVSRKVAKRKVRGTRESGEGSEAQRRGTPIAGLMTKRRKRKQ